MIGPCEARRLWFKHQLQPSALSDHASIAWGPCQSASDHIWEDGEGEDFSLCDQHFEELQFLVMLSGKID